MIEKLISKIKRTIADHNMVSRGQRILLSVSGGPDSILLVYSLNMLKDDLGISISAFTLDHCTREGGSRKDALFVKDLCNKLGIKLYSRKIDVHKWCRKRKLSFQDGARIIRRDLLNELADKYSFDRIATGHNLTDSVETFFINLFRGSGLKGLRGIIPVEGRFIRPLIMLEKNQIEDTLIQEDIVFRVDESNLKDIYLRNKIRNKLLPLIKADYSESIETILADTMDLIREDYSFINEFCSKALMEISQDFVTSNNGYLELDIYYLMRFPKAVKRHIIIASIAALRLSSRDLKKENIDSVIQIVNNTIERKSIDIFEDLKVIKEGNKLFFLDISKKDFFPDDINKLIIEKTDYHVLIEKEQVIEKKPYKIILGDKVLTCFMQDICEVGEVYKKPDKNRAYMDIKKVKFPILVRNWKEGDDFKPFGLGKTKKLSDFFNDLKIPYSKRKHLVLLKDNDKVIWVAGHRMDDRVKIDNTTNKVLVFKYERH